jgi:hypothetical protein
MELIAHRMLTGNDIRGRKYRADPGDRFNVTDGVAAKLIQRGLASVPPPPPLPAPPISIPRLLPVQEGLDSIQALIQQQSTSGIQEPKFGYPSLLTAEQKAVRDYEDKALRPAENKQLAKRKAGRPSTPTRCKSCGLMCESAAAAKRHCK